jgi:hypothetical protein
MLFTMAFIEEDVRDVTLNPEDYIIKSTVSLNVAISDKSFFFDSVQNAGLKVERFDHRGDLGG